MFYIANQNTWENVSKAWSAAFSPPLLTKVSSFILSRLPLSSLSPESHAEIPKTTTHTHSLTLKTEVNTCVSFINPFIGYAVYAVRTHPFTAVTYGEVTWIATVIISVVNIPWEHDTALSAYLRILNWASARLYHPVLMLIFFSPCMKGETDHWLSARTSQMFTSMSQYSIQMPLKQRAESIFADQQTHLVEVSEQHLYTSLPAVLWYPDPSDLIHCWGPDPEGVRNNWLHHHAELLWTRKKNKNIIECNFVLLNN